MPRPTFTLTNAENIRLVDRDGKETKITFRELMLMLEAGARVALLATPIDDPRDTPEPP